MGEGGAIGISQKIKVNFSLRMRDTGKYLKCGEKTIQLAIWRKGHSMEREEPGATVLR